MIDLTDDSKLQLATYVKLERINTDSCRPIKSEKTQEVDEVSDKCSDKMTTATEETDSAPRELRPRRGVNYFRIENIAALKTRRTVTTMPETRHSKRFLSPKKNEKLNKSLDKVKEDEPVRELRSRRKSQQETKISAFQEGRGKRKACDLNEHVAKKSISVGTQAAINSIISNALATERTSLALDPQQVQSIKMALQLFNTFCSSLFN